MQRISLRRSVLSILVVALSFSTAATVAVAHCTATSCVGKCECPEFDCNTITSVVVASYLAEAGGYQVSAIPGLKPLCPRFEAVVTVTVTSAVAPTTVAVAQVRSPNLGFAYFALAGDRVDITAQLIEVDSSIVCGDFDGDQPFQVCYVPCDVTACDTDSDSAAGLFTQRTR